MADHAVLGFILGISASLLIGALILTDAIRKLNQAKSYVAEAIAILDGIKEERDG